MADENDLAREIRSWSGGRDHYGATVSIATHVERLVAGEPAARRGDLLGAIPQVLAAAWRIWILDSEVQNGGYFQYFWNGWSDIAADTASDLDPIGAVAYADLQRSAVSTFGEVAKELTELHRRDLHDPMGSAYQDGLQVQDFHSQDDAWRGVDASNPFMELVGLWLEQHSDEVVAAVHETTPR